MTQRNIQIDTLRGIACILLVAFHIIGDTTQSGLRLEDGIYRELNDLLALIRMPLFTFLSGMVYAHRPLQDNTRQFITGKIRRLLIPMLVVGTTFAVLQAHTPGTNASIQNWHLIHIIPVAHFWFLEAIFLIFMLMIPLERMKVFENKKLFTGIFICASILYISNIEYEYFSISGAIYLFPYFLLGMAIGRYETWKQYLQNNKYILSSISITALCIVYFNIIPPIENRSLIGLGLGTLFCLTLYATQTKNSILAKIGYFSYSIYLYHVFFTAGSRIALGHTGIDNIHITFLLSLTIGIAGPIIVEHICNGTNWTRILFLGKRKIPSSDLWTSKYLRRKGQ